MTEQQNPYPQGAVDASPFVFSKANVAKIAEIKTHYPEAHTQSALLPILDLAQRQNGGWLSPAALEAVAHVLGLSALKVWEVATFYTMFNLEPVGKYLIQMCRTTPCWLRGSDTLRAVCHKEWGLAPGDTTADGTFTLMDVECLGACANGPAVQINDTYYEDLDAVSFKGLLEALARGEDVTPGSVKGRRASESMAKQGS